MKETFQLILIILGLNDFFEANINNYDHTDLRREPNFVKHSYLKSGLLF